MPAMPHVAGARTAPVVLPVNYRLVETVGFLLAVRPRPGNVIESGGPQAAFEIDDMDPIYQKDWSVLVRGTLHRIDPEAADFKDRFDPHPWLVADRDAWLIIELFTITRRRSHPAAPGGPFTSAATCNKPGCHR